MATVKPPTRADFQRLKASHEQLKRHVDELRESLRLARQELRTQFLRIAEMQAILDEERRVDAPLTPNPLTRQAAEHPRERRALRRRVDS